MKSKLLLTTSLAGMLTTVGLSAARNGAEVEGVREQNPYVAVRGGWLFGKTKYGIRGRDGGGTASSDVEKSIGNAWSGSAEFGYTLYDDRLLIGLELGYFTEKATFELPGGGGDKLIFPAEFGNTFGACNVTLRHYFGERGFGYGGVGAGIARVSVTADMMIDSGAPDSMKIGCGANAWSFLGQGFTGLGLCLNENWQLTIGYRLRYLSGNATWKMVDNGANRVEFKMKQDLIYAAEVGVTYRC